MRHWTTESEEETREVGAALASELAPDGLLLLDGDLGTGKTILTQGLASALGIDAVEVQSPTYTLVREHQGSGGVLIHIDLYRLEPEEVSSLGLEELLALDAVKVIEWAERLPWGPVADLHLELRRTADGDGREISEIVSEG
jgi:tRNA threonylcarbamoyladenosine biosynthesis protein TsaE